jgi:hypothetical protein
MLRAMPKPSETVPITLRYEGPDVEGGSMSIEDIVPVLQGFASAYGKIAAEGGGGIQHRIRIVGVAPGSARILLEVWEALGKASGPLTSIGVIGGTATSIVGAIIGVVRIKRHLKKQPFRESITGDNTISISNSENVTISMPVNVYAIYKSRLIDADLAKLAQPLRPGHIESAEISTSLGSGELLKERIEAGEREIFDSETTEVTSTREAWFVAQLNSLTKTTNAGFLFLTDGSRVFYQYVGSSPSKLHSLFGTYDGPVRVYGVAHMDENIKLVRLDISEIEIIQGDLFPKPSSEPGH